MTSPFQRGISDFQAGLAAFQAPQMRQLQMLQRQAELQRSMGLDPVSQQNIAASQQQMQIRQQEQQARQQKAQRDQQMVFGALAKSALDMPEDQRNSFIDSVSSMLQMDIPAEFRTEEYLSNLATAMEAMKPGKETKFEQGTGEMSGYAFDPSTGRYKTDPSILAKVTTRPEKLKMSDIRDINNDVTKLTQNAVGVREGAKSLIDIGDNPSPAQAVASIFKFMKALDPTSVVRQEEQGLVAQASGPMEAFAGYINKITGGGPLTQEVMRDIIKTATGLANSAIEENDSVVRSHISVFPELSEERKSAMLNRIPKALDVPTYEAGYKPPEVGGTVIDPSTSQPIPGVKRVR